MAFTALPPFPATAGKQLKTVKLIPNNPIKPVTF
jgi:hypothetical protein